MRRGYNRKTPELAETAGILHDYAKYIDNEEENHAEKSAIYARKILQEIPEYSEQDITCICEAISNHSKKCEEGNPFD